MREYIIVCNKHKGMFAGCLLFWGHKTEDNEKRSFGGYISDIDNCEMYTLKEIKEKNYNFPQYDNVMDFQKFKSYDNIIIKKSDLLAMEELRTMRVVYRP